MIKTNIIVNLQIEGLHCWPDAKTLFPEVGFLGDLHRHIFHITCKKEVNHDDRDIEIIMFKRDIQKYLYCQYSSFVTPQLNDIFTDVLLCNFGSRSCEMICEELMTQFDLTYCSVLEDGENGAEKTKV